MLWEWDSVLYADGKETPLPSGQDRSASDPVGAPESQAVVSHDRQRYLYVQNGTLTIPHLSGNNYAMYLGQDTQLTTQNGLTATGATGQLQFQGDLLDLRDDTLQVTGPTQITLSGQRTHQPFAVRLSGNPSEINIDGNALAVALPATSAISNWWVPAVGVAAVAAVWGAQRWRRPLVVYHASQESGGSVGIMDPVKIRERRGQGYWVLAASSLRHSRYHRARRYAARALRNYPASRDARFIQVVCLLKCNLHEKVLKASQRYMAEEKDAEQRAIYACLAARSAIALGRRQESLDLLKQAMQQNLAVFESQVGDESYDALCTDPWFKAVREGLEPFPASESNPSAAYA